MVRILMLCEGTYPFYRGGVSTWTHNLISNLQDYEFLILAVTSTPFLQEKYELPANVRAVLNVPLWGTEFAKEHILEFRFRDYLRGSLSTDEKRIREDFAPRFREFISEVKYGCRDPEALGEAINEMHKFLIRYDHRKTVRSKAFWNSIREEISDDKLYQHTRLSYTTDFTRILSHLLRLLSYEYPRVDISHSSAAAFCGIPGIILKIKREVPYIITEHGVYFRERILDLPSEASIIERMLLINLYRAIARVNYYYADKILPVCNFNVNWEEELGASADKIEVIYNGVDVERFRPMKIEPKDGLKRIVVMARIEKLKGIMNIIEAMSHVSEKHPRAICEIYGPISDKTYYKTCLRKIKSLNLEEKVHFMGPTNKPEIAYNRAYMVVQPSLSEGFPFTVVEAMACGKPVVATDVGGVKEAVDGCGIVVTPRSPIALADGILRLLEDENYARILGEEARKRVLKRFTYDGFLENYRRVYLEILSEKILREIVEWRRS